MFGSVWLLVCGAAGSNPYPSIGFDAFVLRTNIDVQDLPQLVWITNDYWNLGLLELRGLLQRLRPAANGSEPGPGLRLWGDALLSLCRFWQIESLYRANAKYQPEWVSPRFICF